MCLVLPLAGEHPDHCFVLVVFQSDAHANREGIGDMGLGDRVGMRF